MDGKGASGVRRHWKRLFGIALTDSLTRLTDHACLLPDHPALATARLLGVRKSVVEEVLPSPPSGAAA